MSRFKKLRWSNVSWSSFFNLLSIQYLKSQNSTIQVSYQSSLARKSFLALIAQLKSLLRFFLEFQFLFHFLPRPTLQYFSLIKVLIVFVIRKIHTAKSQLYLIDIFFHFIQVFTNFTINNLALPYFKVFRKFPISKTRFKPIKKKSQYEFHSK